MSHRSSYVSVAERSIAFRRSLGGRPVFACDQKLAARTSSYNAALSSAGATGFALHGASLFLVWPRKSNQKEGHPYIRTGRPRFTAQNFPRSGAASGVGLGVPSRRDIDVPSLLARHPCLAPPYATPTLGLLKGTRDRVVWEFLNSESNKALQPLAGFAGWKTAKHFPPQSTPRSVSNLAFENRWVSFALPTLRSAETRTTASLHGPSNTTESPLSGGRLESLRRGASGMDAARAVKGHGWPLRGDPRSSDGMREVERSETRMQGQDLLVPFGATAKRNSPSRAKPLPQPTTTNSHYTRGQSHYRLAATCSGCITSQVLPC